MKIIRCDQCKKECSEPIVELHGVAQPSGAILLPAQFHHHDFCSPRCFWRWTAVQLAVIAGIDNPLEKP